MEYEGVAANEAHCSWLDSTFDLVLQYLAGQDKDLATKLGGSDNNFVDKVGQYLSGTALEARRYLESEPATKPDGTGDDESQSSTEVDP